jgi:hypothetical protein
MNTLFDHLSNILGVLKSRFIRFTPAIIYSREVVVNLLAIYITTTTPLGI